MAKQIKQNDVNAVRNWAKSEYRKAIKPLAEAERQEQYLVQESVDRVLQQLKKEEENLRVDCSEKIIKAIKEEFENQRLREEMKEINSDWERTKAAREKFSEEHETRMNLLVNTIVAAIFFAAGAVVGGL